MLGNLQNQANNHRCFRCRKFSKIGIKVAFSVISDIINIGLSIYSQTQAKKTQSVNIVRKESSRMKMKKVSYRFSTIVLLGCVSGCIAVHLNGQSLVSVVSVVSVKRSLPKTYIPGEPVKVILDIDVLPDKAPNGVVIQENLPAGWKILFASPQIAKFDEEKNAASWIFFGGQVNAAEMDITYYVVSPEDAKEKASFLGQLFYNKNKKPVDVKIKGDELIKPAAK
jgi:hypothetical protein